MLYALVHARTIQLCCSATDMTLIIFVAASVAEPLLQLPS